MITKEYKDYICFITQHDHASIALDFFMCFHEDIVGELSQNESLKYAIRNHDVGWIEYDKVPKVSDNREIYTFQNMKQSLQEELWLKSIASSLNPYSQLLIAEHFKKLYLNSKSRKEESKFVDEANQILKNTFRKTTMPDVSNPTFTMELKFLQVCDLISLIICRERDVDSNLVPTVYSFNKKEFNLKIEKIADSAYKFAPGSFKSRSIILEIPYRMLESKLILRPRQLKDEYKLQNTRFRKIELIC
ncbi:MAG: DUF3891 family protein [Thermodesulfobacteriota bacterium]|nr:DUF3891 family protein [Thermodesulfobacteriota bacterium]MEE2975594.1 DUF3891 family protein [Thermodesulfobacteriota bacterium]